MWLKLREKGEMKLRRPDRSQKGLDSWAKAPLLPLFLGTGGARWGIAYSGMIRTKTLQRQAQDSLWAVGEYIS